MASIRKRIWRLKDSRDNVIVDKDGKPIERSAWVVDYADQAGKRRLKTFSTKRDAEAWAVTALHEVKQGTHTPASMSVTVTEAAERWISDCEANGLEFGTIKQRKGHLRLHIGPLLGYEKLSSLTTPRIHQFDADLRNKGCSLSMRKKVLTNLKTILTFAKSQGLVAQNVALDVRIKSNDRNQSTGPLREGHDYPTRAELRTMIDKASGRWRPLLITAIFTGMRASELRGLRWQDVDLDAGVIHVRQRADAWRNIGKPKSAAGSRDIPLSPMVINSLSQWKDSCPAGTHGLVFPNGRGNIESHANIRNRFFVPLQLENSLSVDTGKLDSDGNPIMAAKYGFHALRHTAASLFIAHLGWTPKRVQAVMGHSSVTMTFDRYGHLFEDHEGDREAMKKLEAAVVAA
ncbi:MAG: site-specific integrase [Bradyrhizobium sp.]|nr:site-specific integrase [Bradyrhizobium sp.]